jgi:hypothetical protein
VRLKAALLGLVSAVALGVAIPSPSLAAGAQCSLVLPATVVVDSRTEKIPFRLSSNCAANAAAFALWDVRHASGFRMRVDVSRAEMAAGATSGTLTYPDTAARGVYSGDPYSSRQTDGDPLTQNTPVMAVKTACRVALTGNRGTLYGWTGYTITARASIWSSASHAWTTRRGGTVDLLKLADDGTWKLAGRQTVAPTGNPGKATFWPKGTTRGDKFRVVVQDTATSWSCGSSVHTVLS